MPQSLCEADKASASAPQQSEGLNLKICAVMSIPRVGWNDNWGCGADALRPFQIPVRRFTGAYWGQCLQNAFEECIEDDLDWVICLDYDSMFTYRDVDRLLGWMGNNAEIDAIAALQCRRQDQFPLMSVKGRRKIEVNGNPVKVDTAHFGLTIIRLEDLKEVPKPWLKGEPGTDGTWTHWSRLDPDIWFWHQWKKAGKSVYVAPDVRIGHLELMVTEFDEDMEMRHLHITEWRDREKEKK